MPIDALRGCDGKIKRANETIVQLDAEINAFIKEHFKVAVAEPNHHSPDYVVDATGKKPLDRFSVLIGEVVHHLRSSLDHLVWQLVIATHNRPMFFHEFPVCTVGKKYMRPKTQRKIKGVSDTARALIQQAQPYNRTPNIDDPLLILHKMDIADKHRLLVVTESRVSLPMMYVDQPPDNFILDVYGTGGMAISSNASAELARVRPVTLGAKMKVDAYPTFEVVFPQYGSVSNEPVVPPLKKLSDFTADLINSFRGEF